MFESTVSSRIGCTVHAQYVCDIVPDFTSQSIWINVYRYFSTNTCHSSTDCWHFATHILFGCRLNASTSLSSKQIAWIFECMFQLLLSPCWVYKDTSTLSLFWLVGFVWNWKRVIELQVCMCFVSDLWTSKSIFLLFCIHFWSLHNMQCVKDSLRIMTRDEVYNRLFSSARASQILLKFSAIAHTYTYVDVDMKIRMNCRWQYDAIVFLPSIWHID